MLDMPLPALWLEFEAPEEVIIRSDTFIFVKTVLKRRSGYLKVERLSKNNSICASLPSTRSLLIKNCSNNMRALIIAWFESVSLFRYDWIITFFAKSDAYQGHFFLRQNSQRLKKVVQLDSDFLQEEIVIFQ